MDRRWVDALSTRLFEAGAVGCQEDYLPGEAPPVRQPWDTGPSAPIPDRILLKAWWEYPTLAQIKGDIPPILESLGIHDSPRWVEVVDDGWAETWKASCDRVTICEGLAVAPPWKAMPGDIVIEPGMAFGTGDHPTTLSCLRAVVDRAEKGKRCLDVGTGSGVLAICAARYGMDARGIDIDPESIRATQDNARLNNVSVAVDMSPLADVVGSFDLVVANLFAEVLVDLSEDLKRVTGSHLAVAGVLADRAETVVEALKPMRLVRRQLEGDWCHMGFEW